MTNISDLFYPAWRVSSASPQFISASSFLGARSFCG